MLAISHEIDAGPGVFAQEIPARGHSIDTWLLPKGRRAPGDPTAYDAVMTFGGAMHADQEDEHPWLADEKAMLRDLIKRRVPLLGVCVGSQLAGQLAKVANLLGEAGANIVEVYHQRTFSDLPAKGALLVLVIERPDRSHLEETVTRLRAAGFEVDVGSNHPGGTR